MVTDQPQRASTRCDRTGSRVSKANAHRPAPARPLRNDGPPATSAMPRGVWVLLQAAQAGDDGATCPHREALMVKLYAVVWCYLTPRVTGWRDAPDVLADVVQETVVRLHLAYRTCRARNDGAVRAWACAVARHTFLEMLRSPGTGLMGRQFAAALDDVVRDAASSRRRHSAQGAQDGGLWQSPEESAGRRPEQSEPRELLLRLAVEAYDRAARDTGELLWWRLIVGAEWSEVATHLQTTAAGAKRRFQRAQIALEQQLLALVDALPAETRRPVRRLVDEYLASTGPDAAPMLAATAGRRGQAG